MGPLWVVLSGSTGAYDVGDMVELNCVFNTFPKSSPSKLYSEISVDIHYINNSDGKYPLWIASDSTGFHAVVYGRGIKEGRQIIKGVVAEDEFVREKYSSLVPKLTGKIIDTGVLVTETGPRPRGRIYVLLESGREIPSGFEPYGECVRVAPIRDDPNT